ncbi:MAG: enoyl-CoA hydratase/isomerase family protein [Chlorobi bacterium]|nr:enoyl-CoA hydratase/isomerase family protein [Chlorobiota bacterium]
MSEEPLKVQDTGKAIILTLNDPSTKNALSLNILKLLRETIVSISQSDSPKLLVITGEGDSFSAGADLTYLSQLPQTSLKERVSNCQLVVDLIRELYLYPYPVITAVNGSVIGAATIFLALADFVIAKEGIVIGNPELSIGFAPFVTFTAMALRTGFETSLRIIANGVMPIQKDKGHILIDQITHSKSFLEEVEKVISKFYNINLRAFSKLKLFAREKRWQEFESIFEEAIELNAREYGTSDFSSGLNKLLEKIRPGHRL